jgi:sulfotransferase family protein
VTVRPIFVVGSPRSGTTLIGNYLGSARSVLNVGEYRAIYLAFGTLPVQLRGALTGLVPDSWDPYLRQYIEEVQRHAVDFVYRATEREGRTAFCDSHPRNVLIAPLLARLFPDALFVLTLRHYTGVIQSLMRLGMISLLPDNAPSLDFVEPTRAAAAVLWDRHYQAAMGLPLERTVAFGYDRFCADPKATIARLKQALHAAGFPVEELDDSVFSESHASVPGSPRPTVGAPAGAGTRLSRIPSYDAEAWLPVIERDVRRVVEETDDLMRAVFPHDYASPGGYPGAAALIARAPAAPSPTPPKAAAGSGSAPRARRPRESAAAPPRARRRPPKSTPAADTSSRGRRASGR